MLLELNCTFYCFKLHYHSDYAFNNLYSAIEETWPSTRALLAHCPVHKSCEALNIFESATDITRHVVAKKYFPAIQKYLLQYFKKYFFMNYPRTFTNYSQHGTCHYLFKDFLQHLKQLFQIQKKILSNKQYIIRYFLIILICLFLSLY